MFLFLLLLLFRKSVFFRLSFQFFATLWVLLCFVYVLTNSFMYYESFVIRFLSQRSTTQIFSRRWMRYERLNEFTTHVTTWKHYYSSLTKKNIHLNDAYIPSLNSLKFFSKSSSWLFLHRLDSNPQCIMLNYHASVTRFPSCSLLFRLISPSIFNFFFIKWTPINIKWIWRHSISTPVSVISNHRCTT